MQKPIEGALGYVKKNGKLKLLLTVVIIGTVLLMLGSVILPSKKGNDLSASDDKIKSPHSKASKATDERRLSPITSKSFPTM